MAVLGGEKASMACVLTTRDFLRALSKVTWPSRKVSVWGGDESCSLLPYIDIDMSFTFSVFHFSTCRGR